MHERAVRTGGGGCQEAVPQRIVSIRPTPFKIRISAFAPMSVFGLGLAPTTSGRYGPAHERHRASAPARESAWKKDPTGGVIGVQKGPPW